MICKTCLQTRRRSFFRDGVCDVCDPDIGVPCEPRPVSAHRWWKLSHVTAMARDLTIREGSWVPDAEARDKGLVGSTYVLLERYSRGDYDRTLPGADECDAWLRSLTTAPEDTLSDYECSLALLARKGWVHADEWALAASAYHAWTKTQIVQSDRILTGEWIGTVGERIIVPGCQCTGIKPLGVNPDYPERGERFLISFTAASGQDLKWFTGEGTLFDPKVGETYDIKCTVTKHDDFGGHRSTLVNRCADANAPPRKRGKKE